jgi:hypothetical protein
MTRIAIVVAALLAVTAPGFAQNNQDTIDRALMAAPNRAKEGAGVVSWDASGNRVVLKESSNKMVCYDRSDNPGTRPFAVQCTDEGNLDRVEQTLKAYADGGDRASGQTLLDAMEANGTRIAPVFGSVWHTMNGDDAASAGTHITIAVPGATADSLGIPDSGNATVMWIMDAATSTAHIMVPGR